ncbi:MAG TPA: hypothetical protein VFR31_03515 [Thermoanaerobaculia bacterium]|nr:hypothetical protein [Thermoanaerobaculia bacterium]
MPEFPVLLHPDLYRRLRESDRPSRAGVWKALRFLREGHWGGGTRVKRLKGVARPVFEARTDSGDRLLFTLSRSPLESDPGRMAAHLQVWDWVAHDDVDRAARRNRFPEAEFLELETVEQFDIDEPPPHPEATFAELGATGTAEPLLHFLLPPEGLEPGSDEELGIRWYRIEPDALSGEDEFQRLLDEGGEGLELKLSRDQYEILASPGPVLLAGSAGSGKTTVAIHRLASAPSTALYLSYSPALVSHARQLYRDLAAARGAEARSANFFAFADLYRSFAKEEAPEMTEPLFHEWFRKAGRSLDSVLVWEELRSILKGACLDLSQPMLDEAAYFELGRKRAPLFVNERPEIYRLAQRYQQWLAEEGRSDRIDLCRRAFQELRGGRGRNWDVVVCDEVQDLTELEVAFVLALSRRPDLSGVLLTGDTQQIVQPSGFRWAEVRRLASKGKNRPEVQRLRRNLRSVRPLVELANSLLLLRREVFGRTEEDEPEEAALDGPVPIEVPGSEEAVLAAIEGFGPRCAILATEEETERLRTRLGTSRVFAVREAKGLEFDTVVLWKLLGPDQDLVDRFLRGGEGMDREPRFQRLLQHLYVAVTRARRHLAVHEGPEPHPFWSDRLKREPASNLGRLFRQTASPGEWEKEGEYFLERGHFRQAAECFRRAGLPAKEAEALALADEERQNWAAALDRWTGLNRPDRQAPLLERLGRLPEAAARYREAGMEREARVSEVRFLEARKFWKEAAAAWEALGLHDDAARAWERAGDRRQSSVALARAAEEAGNPAGQLWMDAGDFEAAARSFRAAGDSKRTALALARLHEKAGDWSRAAAAWRLAGDRANSIRCRAEALERDRPGTAAVYRERLGETERALDLYRRGERWLDVARLEPSPGEVLPKVREWIDAGRLDDAQRLVETRRGSLPPPGLLLPDAAWKERIELDRQEHRIAALRAEADAAWARAARQWRLAWEPERARKQQPRSAPAIPSQDPQRHPEAGTFQRLMTDGAPTSEIRTLVRHALHGCPDCGRSAYEAFHPQAPPLDDYDAAFDSIHEKIARGEIQGLKGDVPMPKGIHDHPYVEMLIATQGTRRTTDLSLCEALLHTSRELAIRDPERARRAGELAIQAAEQLHEGLYGPPILQDPLSWSWKDPESEAIRKDEERHVADIVDQIQQLLAWNPPPPERAGLLALHAFLAGCRGRIGEAVRLFNCAASLLRRTGDRHLFGRVLLQKGILLGSAGRIEPALRLIRRSLDLIDPAREPRLAVAGIHHRIWFLARAGRMAEAEAILHAARRLFERINDRRHLGRLYWLEGKIAPRLREAESALVAARDALNREGLGHEAALASLDLGDVYRRERRDADVRKMPDVILALASSGSMLQDTTYLIESAGSLSRDDSGAVVDELWAWMQRKRKENNPPALASLSG